jgi:Chitobiase/beta-hexosaminidase C-terminal domain
VFTPFPIEAAAGQEAGISRIGFLKRVRTARCAVRKLQGAWLFSAWLLFILFALSAPAQHVEPDASYTRSTNYDNTVPGKPVVTVTVAGAEGVSCFTIEEILPACATATVLTGPGMYLPALHAIRWGPFLNTDSATVTYRLGGLPANYPINGGAWMDGQWYFSPGVTMVQVLPSSSPSPIPTPPAQLPAPLFSPASGVVSGTSVNVTITDSDTMTAAGAIIYYTTDGSLPAPASNPNSKPYSAGALDNLPLPSVVRAVAIPSATSGWVASVATLAYYGPPPGTANASVGRAADTGSGSAPVVNYTVTPGAGASCVAVTETLPAGLSATSVSPGGNYIASQNVVEWGPFLAPFPQPLSLSYQAVGLPGTYPVHATWSVDGTNGGEMTAQYIVIASPAAAVIPVPPAQLPAPLFSPASGATVPAGGLMVGIIPPNNAPPNYVIHYTLDGTLPSQSSSVYKVPFNLPAGSSTILRAVAFDPTGMELPSVATVAYYGPTPPADAVPLTIPTPSGNGGMQPTVSLTAMPSGVSCYTVVEAIPHGLMPSALSVTLNNSPDPSGNGFWDPIANVIRWGPYLDNKTRTFSFAVSGASGTYALSSQVSYDGYSTTTPGSVQVNAAPDTMPPTITILVTDGSTVDSANLLVSGTATDSDGISLVTVNGVPANNDTASGGATANWSATVPLHTGANTIIAVASDTINNTASAQITVYYNPPTFGNSSVSSSGGGGPQTLTTTLSGLTTGETVTVYQFTDLRDLNNPNNWTPVPNDLGSNPPFVNPIPVTGSTLTLSIPIPPGSSSLYFIFTVTPQ